MLCTCSAPPCSSEGALSAKPAAPAAKAAPSGKARPSGATHKRSASASSAARTRASSGTASPVVDCGVAPSGTPQQPASFAQLQVPPLALPVPPLPPGWHAVQPTAQQPAAPQAHAAPVSMPQQAQQAQQVQQAESWLDQLLPADEGQHAEQEAAATHLSPSDVDLLLAADSSALQALLHQPCAPPAGGTHQARRPAASQFSQRSQMSDGTCMAPSGAQQAQQPTMGGDLDASMWDSLLAESGGERGSRLGSAFGIEGVNEAGCWAC